MKLNYAKRKLSWKKIRQLFELEKMRQLEEAKIAYIEEATKECS